MSRRGRCIGLIAGLAILGGILWTFWQRDTAPMFYVPRGTIPPAVTATLARSNGPVRALFGPLHALLILPDGSLWEWGGLGGPSGAKVRVPTRIGTNDDWTQAVVASGHYLGIRNDGTLWNWGVPYSSSPLAMNAWPMPFPALPEQVGFESNWVRVAASASHSVVLRHDGTIWAWGDDSLGQMGNGLGPHETNRVRGHTFQMENDKMVSTYLHEGRTNLVQVGTNHDWTAIAAGYGSYTLGLRADGTLWVWGAIDIWGKSGSTQAVYSVPVQVCGETNWVRLEGQVAFNAKGEAWQLFFAPPNLEAPAEGICRLIATDWRPGRSAFGQEGLYQLHDDRTLWTAKLSWSSKERRFGPATSWHKVGDRADWVSVEGSMGTVIGVTADGTVWMWGTDISQEGVEMLQSRFGALKRKVLGWVHAAPGSYSSGGIIPVQREPRPLMHLKPGVDTKNRDNR